MIMPTKIEDLSTELWLEIFPYLKIRHQFDAFFNLNKRLNQIMLSYRTQITWKNNDEDAQYLFKHILPHLTYREDMTSLRLENTNKFDLTGYADLLHFPHLNTLILHRLNITKGILRIFQQSLRYLNISPVVSIEKKSMQSLLEMIISLPNLQICHLRLGISMCLIQPTVQSKSPIKTLRLNGMNEVCFTNRLMVLLQHLPYLQSLHIIANQLNFIPTNDMSCIAPISIFILNINEFIISFVQFTDFILNLTPYVQELKIICRTPIQNLTYLDHPEWVKIIRSLPNLKKLTLDIRRANDIDEKIWDKRCQMLTKLMTINHIVLRIGK